LYTDIDGAAAEPPSGQQGSWTAKSPAPSKRTEVAAAAAGGKIYVIGGFAEPSLGNLKDFAITTRVEAYDPATDRWSAKAPLPVGLHHVGIGVIDGRIYVIGGFSQSLFSVWHPVATVYAYDPSADTWTERRAMANPRGALAVAAINGKLFAAGGYDGTANSAAVEEYDPQANAWSTRAPLPTPRDHLAVAAARGKVYAIGGRVNRDYGRNLSVTEVYDPAADRWTTAADLPTARSGVTSSVINDVIYVLGGESPGGTFSANEAYAASQNRWHVMAPMPTARHGLGSAVVDGRLYVIGGGPKPGGSFSSANEMFTPPVVAGGQRAGASPKHVGAVMALLATFEDAGVLPPENSPDATRLIRALIQFQSALMKSDDAAVQGLLADAMTAKWGSESGEVLARFRAEGWTSESLEALVDYAASRPIWDDPEVREALRRFNIGQAEFEVLANTYTAARAKYAAQGEDVHKRYSARRRDMPGAGL
jgi:N-acetylneuraminic acid mutarotase